LSQRTFSQLKVVLGGSGIGDKEFSRISQEDIRPPTVLASEKSMTLGKTKSEMGVVRSRIEERVFTPVESVVSVVKTEITPVETVVSIVETEITPVETVVSIVETEITPVETVVSIVETEITPVETVLSSIEEEEAPISKISEKTSIQVSIPSETSSPRQQDKDFPKLSQVQEVRISQGADVILSRDTAAFQPLQATESIESLV
jgi:hypothetical protein